MVLIPHLLFAIHVLTQRVIVVFRNPHGVIATIPETVIFQLPREVVVIRDLSEALEVAVAQVVGQLEAVGLEEEAVGKFVFYIYT